MGSLNTLVYLCFLKPSIVILFTQANVALVSSNFFIASAYFDGISMKEPIIKKISWSDNVPRNRARVL